MPRRKPPRISELSAGESERTLARIYPSDFLTFGPKSYRIYNYFDNYLYMDSKTEYLTKEKFDELSKELEELKTVKRVKVAENLEYAKSLGDLSENAEYHEAREAQANVEDRIAKLEAMLKSAVIMSLHHSEVVGIGSIVTLEKLKNKSSVKYKIVGSEEANLADSKLSIHSPLGAATIGKKKNDILKVAAPSGVIDYKIIDID
jgi:transcription elongation factor GreA